MTAATDIRSRLLRSPEAEAAADTAAKVCRMCGTNLEGHRRYKDKDGYLCKDCHRIDKKRRIPCAECGKPTNPENLQPFGPVSICRKCALDHDRDPRATFKRQVSTRHFDRWEKQKTIILIAVIAALILFAVLFQVAC